MPKHGQVLFRRASLLVALVAPFFSSTATADEGGASFWLQGQYGSFAAAPAAPGWSFESTFYHASAAASTGLDFARGGGIQVGMKSPSDFFMFTPTYSIAEPIFAAQAAFGMTALFGANTTSVFATLTGPGGGTLSGSRSDEVTAYGDLYPTASLKWNSGSHNFMLYGTGGIPVGAYQPSQLAALGIGHWATDAGGGYTYLNEQTGFELSAVLGFTYNFVNPYTHYQNGIDSHLDWAISPYLSEKMLIGAVGYFYNQLTGDSGASAALGGFKSRVAGIGPQVGFFFPLGGREAYLNVKAYYDFDVSNRPGGWSAWISLSLEPPEKTAKASNAR